MEKTIVDFLFEYRALVLKLGKTQATADFVYKHGVGEPEMILCGIIIEAVDEHGLFVTENGSVIIGMKQPQFSSRNLPK